MKAAELTGPKRIEPVKTERPEAGRGEAVIRVTACGICGSDMVRKFPDAFFKLFLYPASQIVYYDTCCKALSNSQRRDTCEQ